MNICVAEFSTQRQNCLNWLWLSDTMRHIGSWSTLVHVMAWYLMAPSHYLNQCWLIIKGILCYSPEINFKRSAHEHFVWIFVRKFYCVIMAPHCIFFVTHAYEHRCAEWLLTITWTNVDPDLCGHMASLGHNVLNTIYKAAFCTYIDSHYLA